jgi:hypothetical protein
MNLGAVVCGIGAVPVVTASRTAPRFGIARMYQ